MSLRADETWCANPSAWPGAMWISSSIYGQREYPAAAIEPHEEHFKCLDCKTKLKRWKWFSALLQFCTAAHQAGADVMFCARSRPELLSAPRLLSLSLWAGAGGWSLLIPWWVTPGPAPRHRPYSGPGSVKPASHPSNQESIRPASRNINVGLITPSVKCTSFMGLYSLFSTFEFNIN